MFINNFQGSFNPAGQFVANMSSVNNVVESVRGDDGVSWDHGLRRPYICPKTGRPTVMIRTGRTTLNKGVQVAIREPVQVSDLVNNFGIHLPIYNATMLRKEQWIELDARVIKAARFRLRAYQDLAAANSFGGFDAMAKSVLEYENMTDPGEAIVDMDGMTEGRSDAPKFGGQGLPLPITHCDFWMSSRKLAESRNSSTPLNTVMGEAAGRRVAETIEKTTIGVTTGIVYGGSNTALTYTNTSAVYGYTNFPQRLTKTNMRRPDVGTWTPSQTLADVLACLDQLKANKFYGPFMIYHSNDWDQYLDTDYILTGGNVATQTLRQRLYSIGREDNGSGGANTTVQGVRRLDFLFGSQLETNPANAQYRGPGAEVDATLKAFRMVFVQMTSDVARAINGMDVTTLQWESVGGMRLNFKVMAIQAPQLFADAYGNCGILDATNS